MSLFPSDTLVNATAVSDDARRGVFRPSHCDEPATATEVTSDDLTPKSFTMQCDGEGFAISQTDVFAPSHPTSLRLIHRLTPSRVEEEGNYP